MTIHYAIATELGRQHREQIAADYQSTRPLRNSRRAHWWQHRQQRSSNLAAAAATSHRPATA